MRKYYVAWAAMAPSHQFSFYVWHCFHFAFVPSTPPSFRMNFYERIPFGMKSNERRKRNKEPLAQRDVILCVCVCGWISYCLNDGAFIPLAFENAMIRFHIYLYTNNPSPCKWIWCIMKTTKFRAKHHRIVTHQTRKNARRKTTLYASWYYILYYIHCH